MKTPNTAVGTKWARWNQLLDAPRTMLICGCAHDGTVTCDEHDIYPFRTQYSFMWTMPKHPGDAVRIARLYLDGEPGDVCIQHYGKNVRVGTFLPGNYVCLPGDTPKVEPEESEWFDRRDLADACFDRMVNKAKQRGWVICASKNRP